MKTEQPRRISLLAEAIGYVGAILILAGGGTAVGQRWNDLSQNTRIAVIASASAAFLIAGIFARRSREPAFQRLSSVVWVISTAGFAATAGMIGRWTLGLSERGVVSAAAVATTAYATILWLFNRRALQHLALFIAGATLVNSSVAWTSREVPSWAFGISLWAYGVAWALAGWRRILTPWWAAVSLGTLAALVAPSALETSDAARFALGIGTAATVMALSVASRFTAGLAMGAVGLFGYVTGAVVRYFGDTLGVPTALALTGVVILVLAVLTTRLVGYTRQKPVVERRHLRRVA